MSDRSVTEHRSDEAFKALVQSLEDRLTALESRRTQGDIQLKSLVVNEDVATAGRLQVGDTGGIVGVIAPVVTTLPADPYDGQTIRYLAGSNRLWTLVYGGEALEPYPWLFAGGAGLHDCIVQNEQDTTAPYNDLTTPGPIITIPLDGYYDLEGGVYVNNSTAGSTETATPVWAPTGGFVGFSVVCSNPGVNGSVTMTLSASGLNTLLVGAPSQVKMQYSTGGSSFYAQRWMRATPVRVGA